MEEYTVKQKKIIANNLACCFCFSCNNSKVDFLYLANQIRNRNINMKKSFKIIQYNFDTREIQV